MKVGQVVGDISLRSQDFSGCRHEFS
ncbi:hypothetical protein AERO8C_70230 [Aeromonas veronii]|uniref:Uncharacterized protein n=1 Tax=Aeromonas veronii TaxID=654 RepID=A0A653LCN7_AERVE|nr:hypothetical protein AERO8C_70230 [Aeromonas veronii]